MATQSDINIVQMLLQEQRRNDMTMIDFKTWAEHIILVAQENGTAHEEIERALEQAYNQGYHLGLNSGWAIEQDKDYV